MPMQCHKLVKKVAMEMAAETYEMWAKGSDEFYGENRSQGEFVKQMWPAFIERARTTLVGLLRTNIADTLKDEIADAIIKDRSIRFGKTNSVQIGEW